MNIALTSPMEISPSILPSVRITGHPDGPAWVCLDSPKAGESGPMVISILLPDGKEVRSDRFRPRGDIREAMECALSFLGAAGEAYRYRMHTQRPEPDEDSNENLFPAPVPEFAYMVSDELSMLQMDLTGELEDA